MTVELVVVVVDDVPSSLASDCWIAVSAVGTSAFSVVVCLGGMVGEVERGFRNRRSSPLPYTTVHSGMVLEIVMPEQTFEC